jgi:hypothetical protein
VSQIGEQAGKQQRKQELQGKEQEHLRLSASLGFLPVPQKPGAQNTQQNVWAAPAPVKPAPIPQAQHEKGSDWQVKLVLLALPFLYTLFFMSIHRGLLGIAIIAVGVPGYGCFVATELALKLWSSQRKFAAFFTSFAIFYLCLILFFVFFVMLPNISYLIKGDPPGAPSSITPGIPNTFLTSTALCTGGSTDPSCSAKQVFDDYCLELSNGGETPPYLYLTSRSSKFMPGRTEIHGCMHKQVYCPTG